MYKLLISLNGLPITALEAITLNCTRKDVLCESDQPFFSEHVVNVWNNLPASVDFKSLSSFKHTVKLVDFSKFLKCFLRRSYVLELQRIFMLLCAYMSYLSNLSIFICVLLTEIAVYGLQARC